MEDLYDSVLDSRSQLSERKLNLGIWLARHSSSLLRGLDLAILLVIPTTQACLAGGIDTVQRRSLILLILVVGACVCVSPSGDQVKAMGQDTGHRADGVGFLYGFIFVSVFGISEMPGHWQNSISWRWLFEIALVPTSLFLLRPRIITAILQLKRSKGYGGAIIVCNDHCPAGLIETVTTQNLIGILYLNAPCRQTSDEKIYEIKNLRVLDHTIRQKNPQEIIFLDQPNLTDGSVALQNDLLETLLSYPIRISIAINIEAQFRNRLFNKSVPYKIVQIDSLVDATNRYKRAFDVLVGFILFILSIPLLLMIGFAIRLSGPGPVIFRQIRVGAHGIPFTVLKFRTMTVSAESCFVQAQMNDPRVTKIGRFLRRTSLDELLQLINVLRGEMSLVGPRPHAPGTRSAGLELEHAVKFYSVRHRVKPGMTGLAQIRGQRGSTLQLEALEQRIASDLEYIERWSLRLDAMIMIRTLAVFFTQRNAY